jgi:DNA polymerase V
LIRHPAATFFVRVVGDSMIGAGIFPGDILIVDRSLEPQDKNVVIAVVDSELTVKRLFVLSNKDGNVVALNEIAKVLGISSRENAP